MLCSKCGASVSEGDNFCEECGASLKKHVSTSSPVTTKPFPKSEIVVYDNNLASATNIGRRHVSNEDSGIVLKRDNGDIVLIVADGVSSSVNATSASQKAINEIKDVLIKKDDSAKNLISLAIHSADECIKALPFENKEDGIYGPETTVVTAIVQENTVTIGWVGDSRAYIFNQDKQDLLTIDDSWIELVVNEGLMTREQATLDKRAHCVTQVLGMHDQPAKIHILECKIKEGDLLMLCSDGLWNYFQNEKALLNTIIAYGINSDAVDICEHLVGLANAAGGHDNITVALYRKEINSIDFHG
jgi:serine/threonine protein phosphatase PrpC